MEEQNLDARCISARQKRRPDAERKRDKDKSRHQPVNGA
jgi:hypothetical protein